MKTTLHLEIDEDGRGTFSYGGQLWDCYLSQVEMQRETIPVLMDFSGTRRQMRTGPTEFHIRLMSNGLLRLDDVQD